MMMIDDEYTTIIVDKAPVPLFNIFIFIINFAFIAFRLRAIVIISYSSLTVQASNPLLKIGAVVIGVEGDLRLFDIV